MRVATVDGLVTLFYDGSKELFHEELQEEWLRAYYFVHNYNDADWEEWDLSDQCKRYWQEKFSWQQIIVMEGVTEIQERTFYRCVNIQKVIFANTVIQIEEYAFKKCTSLISIKLPIHLEYIGRSAFDYCDLISVFIPSRCREIGREAFQDNRNLTLFHVPQQTELDLMIIDRTKLLEESYRKEMKYLSREVNSWLKNINNDERYSLHRACASYQPLKEVIHAIIQQKGIGDFQTKNEIDVNPSRYLKENPYCDLKEMDVIRDYMMKMIGENE